jgi:putative ABC transport system substrate-binding protein
MAVTLECRESKREVTVKHWQIALSVVIALSILMEPSACEAQQKAKVYRIGCLGVSTYGAETDSHNCPIKFHPNWQATIEGLRERGYIQGQNLSLECRWTEGQDDRAPSLAAELVSLKPDLMVANGTVQVRAAKQATTTIPIVMTGVLDPVGRGLVSSLARPGGNVTGLTDTLAEMEGKRLQFLKEIAPKISRVAVLYRGSGGSETWMSYMEAPARALGLKLQLYGVKGPEELADAFAAMTKAGEEALYLVPLGFWETGDNPQRIAELAAQHHLPSTYQAKLFVEAGGLMAYHVDMPAIRQRVGVYVDKILNGANPGDLPVEQPTKLNLVINLKTATALGLTIPQTLFLTASEIISPEGSQSGRLQ